jgi:hypothetical protein
VTTQISLASRRPGGTLLENMPNRRGPGQKLIPVPASEKFIRELNHGFRRAGYTNRSQFIRDAIVEKLERLGLKIPRELAVAPQRLGKGGGKPASKAVAAPGRALRTASVRGAK